MTPQIPAEGILKTNDWGDSKVYRIACECGDESHNHNVFSLITSNSCLLFNKQKILARIV